VAPQYKAVDLGLEASLVAGLLGGYVTGLVSGALISLPAMFSPRVPDTPLLVGVGVMGGLLRDVAPDTEEIWRFSPVFDLSFYRIFSRRHDRYRTAFQLFFLLAILFAEFLRLTLGHAWPASLFSFYPAWPDPHPAHFLAGLCEHHTGCDAAAQDLEQRPQRDQAGGAAPPAIASVAWMR